MSDFPCVALTFSILMCAHLNNLGMHESVPEDKKVNYFEQINTLIDLSDNKQGLLTLGL